ncbi:dynein regulatory complex subunit 5 [Eucyclogobius newberryi]|uniref:dynein regulatory complex subunit 5 n=1 Tax=Eucyclogobius newberryi TaxID=166745 RepID=UPI003B58BA71
MTSANRRRIIAEDPTWSLEQVPFLSKLCLQAIMKNIEGKPLYKELSRSEQNFIQEKLTLHVPLKVTAKLIPDGVYWQRRSKELWDNCDVSYHGQSWKRLFFERFLEKLIEAFLPGETELKTILEMLPLCKDYVKRLNIEELLLPIRPQEEDEATSIHEEETKPTLDRFNFNFLLEKLINLQELYLVYRIKRCGMNYKKEMFQMTQGDCKTLAQAVASCKTLKVLHLHQSNVGDAQCRLLVKHLLNHPSLTELDFSYNYIEDRGARAIGKLLSRSKLRTLTLYCNKIQEHGARAIAHALSRTSTLEELNLGVNRVGDEGGQAIAKALLTNSSLKTLNLSANDVAERTAVSLADVLVHNRTLRSINLFHGQLGVNGGNALRKAMSKNSTVIKFVLDLTDMEEDDIGFIQDVVWANEERALSQKQ